MIPLIHIELLSGELKKDTAIPGPSIKHVVCRRVENYRRCAGVKAAKFVNVSPHFMKETEEVAGFQFIKWREEAISGCEVFLGEEREIEKTVWISELGTLCDHNNTYVTKLGNLQSFESGMRLLKEVRTFYPDPGELARVGYVAPARGPSRLTSLLIKNAA